VNNDQIYSLLDTNKIFFEFFLTHVILSNACQQRVTAYFYFSGTLLNITEFAWNAVWHWVSACCILKSASVKGLKQYTKPQQ